MSDKGFILAVLACLICFSQAQAVSEESVWIVLDFRRPAGETIQMTFGPRT